MLTLERVFNTLKMKNKIEQLLIDCFYLSSDNIDFDIDQAVDELQRFINKEIIKAYNKGLEFENEDKL